MGDDVYLETREGVVLEDGEDPPAGLSRPEVYVWVRWNRGHPVSRLDWDIVEALKQRGLAPREGDPPTVS